MAKHTQGEWGVATMDCGMSNDEICTEVNGCVVSIAEMLRGNFGMMEPDGKGGSREYASYELTKEEAAANARLIAAAPNLLAALESLLLAVRSNNEDGSPKTQDQIFSEAGHEAIAAISKAKAK